MKLASLFHEDHVLVNFKANDFQEVVRRLLETMPEDFNKPMVQEIARKIIDREYEHPTTVLDDICLLHLRMEEIKDFRVAIAVTDEPVDHPIEPDKKLRIFFLILAPQEQNTLMLQTLAGISRLLQTKNFLPALRTVRTPGRLIRLIEESGLDVRRNIMASDLMEPIRHSVKMDMMLPEAIQILSKAQDEGIPVIENDVLLGEFTSKEILQLGMPKYMDLLVNPDMLNAFEPFENYFRSETKATVRDICRRDFVTVAPSTPIVGVAHLMITKNRRRIYVLDDGKVEGIIYRKGIVERVFNL